MLLILGVSYKDIKEYCDLHKYNIRDRNICYAYGDNRDDWARIYGCEIHSMITLPGVPFDLFQIGLSRMRY